MEPSAGNVKAFTENMENNHQNFNENIAYTINMRYNVNKRKGMKP